MVVSEALSNLIRNRIRIRHQLNSTNYITIKDVEEVKGKDSSVNHKDYAVLYNYYKNGEFQGDIKSVFTMPTSILESNLDDIIKQDESRYTLGDSAPKADMVNSPDHYKKRYIREVIQSIKGLCTPEEYRGYLKGSKIKYLARYQDKGGIEDLEKGQWFGAELIAFEKEQINQKQEETQ